MLKCMADRSMVSVGGDSRFADLLLNRDRLDKFSENVEGSSDFRAGSGWPFQIVDSQADLRDGQ